MIQFLNQIIAKINEDKVTNSLLRVVFLPNFNVSLAELIIPGIDLAHLVTVPGTEAYGASSIKMLLNGVLTFGSYDAMNTQVADRVGEDSIFVFGTEEHLVE